MRLWIVLAVLSAINFYMLSFFTRTQMVAGSLLSVRLGAFFFALFFLLQGVAPLFDIAWHFNPPLGYEPAYTLLMRLSYIALGVSSVLLFYVLCADVLFFAAARLLSPATLSLVKKGGVGVILCLTALNVGLGLSQAQKTALKKIDLPIADLPAVWEGTTIAQISDLHIGHFTKKAEVEKVVTEITGQKPDMIVITGDLADGSVERLKADAAPLSSLQAPLGLYYVTGNHEYYWDAPGWMRWAEEAGLTVLLNRSVLLEKGGEKLAVIGIPDPTSSQIPTTEPMDIEKALKDVPSQATKILLAHQPKETELAARKGIQAQLSGHTHGGQYFPYTFLFGFVLPYPTGLQSVEGLTLYINHGTGFWGPPLRTNGKGEITLFTLRKAARP